MNRTLQLSVLMILLWGVACSGWAEERSPERLRKPFWTQGRETKAAFAEVVKAPRLSTVDIVDGETPLAMGVIVGKEGWILTKASQLTEGAQCKFFDGRVTKFEYVGFDHGLDLALLKVSGSDFQPMEWARETPRLGEWLITTGTGKLPVGVGVMSVPRRPIERSDTFGVLGVKLAEQPAAIVESAFANSGAEMAGLKAGDEIRMVNETRILGKQHMIDTIRKFRPGETVVIEFEREGSKKSVQATLSEPFGEEFLSRIALQQQLGGRLSLRRDDFEAVLEHDTVLKPEECGGAVVNLDGQGVGINIARAGRTSSYLLPADLILKKLESLKSGQSPPPVLQASLPTVPQTGISSGE